MYHAVLAQVDSNGSEDSSQDENDEDDEEDAQTVIFKSSPFSSPGNIVVFKLFKKARCDKTLYVDIAYGSIKLGMVFFGRNFAKNMFHFRNRRKYMKQARCSRISRS